VLTFFFIYIIFSNSYVFAIVKCPGLVLYEVPRHISLLLLLLLLLLKHTFIGQFFAVFWLLVKYFKYVAFTKTAVNGCHASHRRSLNSKFTCQELILNKIFAYCICICYVLWAPHVWESYELKPSCHYYYCYHMPDFDSVKSC